MPWMRQAKAASNCLTRPPPHSLCKRPCPFPLYSFWRRFAFSRLSASPLLFQGGVGSFFALPVPLFRRVGARRVRQRQSVRCATVPLYLTTSFFSTHLSNAVIPLFARFENLQIPSTPFRFRVFFGQNEPLKLHRIVLVTAQKALYFAGRSKDAECFGCAGTVTP